MLLTIFKITRNVENNFFWQYFPTNVQTRIHVLKMNMLLTISKMARCFENSFPLTLCFTKWPKVHKNCKNQYAVNNFQNNQKFKKTNSADSMFQHM